MLRYVGSQVLHRNRGEWEDINLLDCRVSDIQKKNRYAYIKIMDDDGEINILNVKNIASYNYTIRWLLSSINAGDTTPEYTERIPNKRLQEARYSNVYQSGFTVSAFDTIGGNNIRGCHKSYQDLRISSNIRSRDAEIAGQCCLFSVNGLLFNHGISNGGVIIKHAGRSIADRIRAHVGLLSFYKMGGLSTSGLSLTTDQDRSNLSDIIFINSKKIPGKATFLVLGGFIVPEEDGIFYRIDDNKMAIRIGGLPYMERVLRMLNSINVEHLKIPENVKNAYACSRDYFYGDEFLTALLLSSSSFCVTVNTPIITFEVKPVRTGRYPGLIIQDFEPILPIVADCGRILEYWKSEVDRYWHINAKDTHYRDYVLESDMLVSGGMTSETLKSKLVHHRAKIGFLSITGYK